MTEQENEERNKELRQQVISAWTSTTTINENFMVAVLGIQFVAIGWIIKSPDFNTRELIIILLLFLSVIFNFYRFFLVKKLLNNNLNMILKFHIGEDYKPHQSEGIRLETKMEYNAMLVFLHLLSALILFILPALEKIK